MAEEEEVSVRRDRKSAFSIANRVWLVMGLLLFLFFVTSTVSHFLTKQIEDDVRRLVLVEGTQQDAVAQMGIRLAEIAGAVFSYARDGAGTGENEINRREGDFDRAVRIYRRLADTDEERDLSRKIAGFFEDFKSLTTQIIALSDEQRTELVPLRAKMQTLDALIEERVRLSREGATSATLGKFEAMLGMDSKISEYISYLEPGFPRWIANLMTCLGDSAIRINAIPSALRANPMSPGG